jgi:carboxypeptidase C (cathepsin A)
MKSRLLLTLPLAASLFIPALAQDASQSSNTQNQAAPAATTTQNSNLSSTSNNQAANSQADSSRQPLVYQERQGFWGKINPFAR